MLAIFNPKNAYKQVLKYLYMKKNSPNEQSISRWVSRCKTFYVLFFIMALQNILSMTGPVGSGKLLEIWAGILGNFIFLFILFFISRAIFVAIGKRKFA